MKYRALKLLSIFALILFVASCSKDSDDEKGKPEPSKPVAQAPKLPKKELRGVWIATVWDLDWPMGDYSVNGQKEKYVQYLEMCEKLNMNAVFFQVRGMADAFYESKYAPWSKSITGEAGKKPSYDVLRFMIDEAHKRNIQFHAWINPYRVATRANKNVPFAALDNRIPAKFVKDYNRIRILNPALPEVRTFICNVVDELLTKYGDIDGVHIDDYFYPSLESGEQLEDGEEFKKYGAEQFAKIEDFRRNNVSLAIHDIFKVVTSKSPDAVFSVSPAGNPDNNRNVLYADVAKWCKEGWVDLLIPQLYYPTGSASTNFGARLSWWMGNYGKSHVAIGYGIYKFGQSYGASYQNSGDIYLQFEQAGRNRNIEGSVLYSASDLQKNRVGIRDAIKNIYRNRVLPPYLGRTPMVRPKSPVNVRISDGVLRWDASGKYTYAVYRSNGNEKVATLVGTTVENYFKLPQLGKSYFVTAVDKHYQESEISEVVK